MEINIAKRFRLRKCFLQYRFHLLGDSLVCPYRRASCFHATTDFRAFSHVQLKEELLVDYVSMDVSLVPL